MRQHNQLEASWLRTLALAGAMLALDGCSEDPPSGSEAQAQAQVQSGETTPISQLPFVDAASNPTLLGELLAKPTALNETTALHMRLPPPNNPQLADSLVRIIGPVDSPQILFRSDALAQLGVISQSPGKEFFTAFSSLSQNELATLQQNAGQIAQGAFGQTTRESVLFDGRNPTARTINPAIDPSIFRPGILVPVRGCSIRPVSTLAAWGKALFITDPQVVLDPARTWDPCTGVGTKGGVWTFAHLMREMANGSGTTPEDFVTQWLSLWLNNQVINSDSVTARLAMFNQVITPWAVASGVTATLVTDSTGHRSVTLSGPLDLGIAPFRLLAIVNRIDLGKTSSGGGPYGPITGLPETPGELRFIFDVVQPNPWGAGSEATCGKKRFTTIFEYGVPGTGCSRVVSWAKQWSSLLTFPGFTAAYRAQLQTMTESVVIHGAAPLKGNQNAINQIRTNEIALTAPWELREFTLTNENPAAGTDTPASGLLRTHTVAQTPDDGAYPAVGSPAIDTFIRTNTPGLCAGTTIVPFSFLGAPFRGGNALIGPGHWNMNPVPPPTHAEMHARHCFSLNTCHGCHRDDSGTNGLAGSTNFTHIDPLSAIPVTLSKFLTGGGPGSVFNVADTQFPTMLPLPPHWQFADLERRFQHLFDLSHCTSCTFIRILDPRIIDPIIAHGPVPVDPDPTVVLPFKVGPITDLAFVRQLLDLRAQFATGSRQDPVDNIRVGAVMTD